MSFIFAIKACVEDQAGRLHRFLLIDKRTAEPLQRVKIAVACLPVYMRAAGKTLKQGFEKYDWVLQGTVTFCIPLVAKVKDFGMQCMGDFSYKETISKVLDYLIGNKSLYLGTAFLNLAVVKKAIAKESLRDRNGTIDVTLKMFLILNAKLVGSYFGGLRGEMIAQTALATICSGDSLLRDFSTELATPERSAEFNRARRAVELDTEKRLINHFVCKDYHLPGITQIIQAYAHNEEENGPIIEEVHN